MKKIKHYTIPVFVPEMACPFQCAFCNQQKISGHYLAPDFSQTDETIRSYLRSFKQNPRFVEVGFFGGTFTGIPAEVQEGYLKVVQPYLKTGQIKGIRLSTRPDYIDEKVLTRLKKYNVTTIELGAQSLNDDVLKASFRGHTAYQVEAASKKIKSFEIDLGLQMMIGLPRDTLDKSMETAKKIIDFGASNTRIYPSLVIKNTAMHRWYLQGKYQPLSIAEAVNWSKVLLPLFENNGVNVIRLGLHPSEGLLNGSELVAGPFHPSFRELVLTEIWSEKLQTACSDFPDSSSIEIQVFPKEINVAIGYKAVNKKKLQQKFKNVIFTPNDKALPGQLIIRSITD